MILASLAARVHSTCAYFFGKVSYLKPYTSNLNSFIGGHDVTEIPCLGKNDLELALVFGALQFFAAQVHTQNTPRVPAD